MTIRRLAIPLAVAATLAAASGGVAGAGSSVSLRYHGGIPSGAVEMTPHSGPTYGAPTWMNAGGGWFAVPASATFMSAEVVDDSRRGVAADIRFLVQQYEPLVAGPRFCDSVSGVGIPLGAQAVYVRVLTAESLQCSPPGVPTTGIISVEFGP